MIDSKELYSKYREFVNKEVNLQGWIRNHRKQKDLGFIDFNDGTFFKGIQLIYDNTVSNFEGMDGIDTVVEYISSIRDRMLNSGEYKVLDTDIPVYGFDADGNGI